MRTITLTALRRPVSSSGFTEASTGGYSAEELVELGMRVALFGEPNPLGTLSFMASGTNPLPQLAGLNLSEDSFAQLAELLIGEELLSHPGVDHLTGFRIGPAVRGSRQLRVSWMPRQRYSNVLPEARSIEGSTVAT